MEEKVEKISKELAMEMAQRSADNTIEMNERQGIEMKGRRGNLVDHYFDRYKEKEQIRHEADNKFPEVRYLYPHFDYGNSQDMFQCILDHGSDDIYNYNHGDVIDRSYTKRIFDKDGSLIEEKLIKRKATFRIVDKEYDKEWIKENIEDLKQKWAYLQELAKKENEDVS